MRTNPQTGRYTTFGIIKQPLTHNPAIFYQHRRLLVRTLARP
jgi:hypothetical protein